MYNNCARNIPYYITVPSKLIEMMKFIHEIHEKAQENYLHPITLSQPIFEQI